MSPREWPPIIRAERAPLRIRMRDVAITLAAWALFAWWIRGAIALVLDYLGFPMFELTRLAAPDWERIWWRIAPYLGVAAAFSAWLVLFAMYRGALLARQHVPGPPPLPLELEAHAARFGAEGAKAARLRDLKVATVVLEPGGRIEEVRADAREPNA